ncbi:RNA polymerase, sigma 54 subunit, RpoN/SigL [Caloranaerobacter azorensis DSM 13643]|uniref:RNA polymerase, sigma 54 subunit, RpoN/SigL n=1 Tax=Caloranaerobacter azorensis DSM 13643 TaxID=1121264 RepID=A0A1M5SER1_9FIRM|nr:RNA polymerase factor sigma-54 [Caloranaerobacter azorensis]SHH36971.1 RNA polymerase, sigma 54 subunit, RpoN/SigL [Caloranaerobacter azorensis DSM 13643]
MRLGFELSLQQSQKLIMTPELRQAIKILQYTNFELSQFIEEELEKNPLLEIESREDNAEKDIDLDELKSGIDWKEYLGKYDDISYSSYKEDDSNDWILENYITYKTTLKEHLLFQLNLTLFDEMDKKIGEFIIESLDENGYLRITTNEIANRLKVDDDRVENVLKIIQTFDPVGVGAKDLKECLKIQLEDRGIKDPYVFKVLENYLEEIACNKLTKISKELGISIKKVQNICDLIKTLEPKPGRGFINSSDDVKFIKPDVTLEIIDGEYIIQVNDVTAPRLTVNNYYRRLLNQAIEEAIVKFIKCKLDSALWLIKSIEQRRMTIYRVAEAIVRYQREFFEKGKKALKPLSLKVIADELEIHESTVSRAINGKYIQTPKGIFELKFFFSRGVLANQEEISSTSVKSMIKELIESEDPKKPLSDQKITDILRKKNIKISRRTVAKYRDELNIPSSNLRKRY